MICQCHMATMMYWNLLLTLHPLSTHQIVIVLLELLYATFIFSLYIIYKILHDFNNTTVYFCRYHILKFSFYQCNVSIDKPYALFCAMLSSQAQSILKKENCSFEYKNFYDKSRDVTMTFDCSINKIWIKPKSLVNK